MKLSDISSQKLSPGRYLITASYDGNAEYNPAQAQLVLVIDANGEAHYDTEPIDDEGAPQIVKVSPQVAFNPTTLDIVEKNVEYPFDWLPYFTNPFDVGYNISVSEGLTIDQNSRINWEVSGTYTLTLTTQETDIYEPQTIQLELNITAKTNPQIEYVNNDEQFTLENGNFTKRYRNIEKREGVYMFDLLQPTNPYALPLKYKIDDTKHGTIDTDDNKIYISEEGKYKITAYYEGDDTYRSSITYYILKYYEGEEPAEDEPTPQGKINPNLSFAQSNVTQDKENDNLYKVLPLINPYSVTGGTWVVSKGSITYDGTTITYDGTGSITVSYIFNGNDKYEAQTVSYILNIKSEDNPDNLPVPDIGFSIPIVTVEENEAHEYQIQAAYNNSGVAINYYYNDELIENGILKTTNTGNLTIVGISENNGTFASTKIYYTLKITQYQQKDPEISFDSASVNEYQSDNFEYLLQFVNNPHNVELEWSTSNGVIYDNVLYCEDLGTIIITVKSKASFYYYESTISYTLVIEEVPKLSPELSFDEEAQFFNLTDTHQYQVQSVNNPHNVELRWFSDRGELNSEMNPTILTISSYSGPVNIYCKSIEDDTYKSEMVYYKLYVGAAKKYLQYTKHADYSIEKNQGTFDLEMLRYAKSQDLEFDPTEWRFTSSLPSYCTVNEKYYIEEDDYIVVMANLTITKPCNPLISITFSGNDYFYSSSNIRVHVNLVGKDLLNPEISFSNSYEVTDIKEDYKYTLQEVQNPHNVDIVYSSSAGTVEGNVLTYRDKFNVIIKATSIEDDTYASQTISYKLEFKEPQKPSSGIHFPLDTVTVTQTNEGIYELQGLLDAEDEPIADSSLLGYYDSNLFGDISYDDNRGCYIIEQPNWNGNATIKFIIYETATYRKETITYKLTILSNEKPSPNLAFEKYQINVTQNSNGIYPLQALINPNNVPVTWFCSKGEFDNPNNPQNIIFSGREYIRVSVRSTETENFKSEEQAYGMTIMLPSKRDAGLNFDSYQVYTQRKDDGIYPLQRANNPNNVSPLTYSVSKGRIEGDNIIYDGIGTLTITVSYPGNDVYEAVNLRYTLDIGGKFNKYLEVENCQSVEMTGELNEDIEVQLVRWNANKDYTFNPNEWTITSSHFRCTYKSMRTEEINGYVYLIGRFSFKAEGTAYITTSFKGNDDFYNDEGHGLWIEYTVPTVVDNRVLPSISFNNYMVYVTQNNNYLYLLQTLNKPDDVEIDHWEINYGGADSSTAKIIDDEYVYYEGTDYVNVKVYTKESDIYKPTSDSYTLYVNEKTKTGTSIYFTWDKINTNRTLDSIYNIQSAHISPSNLPVVWSTTKGTLTDNNTKLNYSDIGEVTITCSFEGNEEYEAASASYKIIISSQYVQRDLNATRCGDQHLVIEYNTEYDVPLIKWPLSENLEYDPNEWILFGDYDTKWNAEYLYTVDDNEYRTLYAKMTFNQDGYTYYTLKLQNNAFFYDSTWHAEIYFEKPAPELIEPKISWVEDGDVSVPVNAEHKYLIKEFTSEYNDVEFEVPECTAGDAVISKEGDDYYVTCSTTYNLYIYVQNKSNNKYIVRTLSYHIKVYIPEVKPAADLSFSSDRYTVTREVSNTYQPKELRNRNNVPVTWHSNLGTIDPQTGVLTYDGTGEVVITVIFEGNDDYVYTEASYTLLIKDPNQIDLVATKKGDQTLNNIDYNQNYTVELLRWNKTQDFGRILTFNSSEWSLTNDNSTRCIFHGFDAQEDNGVIILSGIFSFTANSYSYYTLTFTGNTDFYGQKWGAELYFNHIEPQQIDPKISWPNPNPGNVDYREDNKYLIQTPISEYDDVEFNEPYSGKTVIKEGDNYYIQYSSTGPIDVYVSNKGTSKYYSHTISYRFTIVAPQVKPTHTLSFNQSTFNRNKSKENEYNLLTPSTNGDVNDLIWVSDKDDCTIDPINKKVCWSGTGSVKITAYYMETEDYGYVEASYIMVVSETVQKTYLQASEYKSQTIEVDFGTEYDIPIIKWPLTENLEYDEDEWYLSNSYSTKCVVDHLFTVDEGDYRILKAKCTFTTSGFTYLRIRFVGNDYFYGSNYNGFELYFNRATDIEVRDPQISWPNPTPDPIPYSDEHLYLIQTPTSPFPEVTFDAPTPSSKVVEIDGSYYYQTENWGDYTISVSSRATGVLTDGTTRYMYASKTIKYTLTIERPVIEKTDARLAFDNDIEVLEYQWQSTGRKLYKVQPLYNPYGVPVSFRAYPYGGLQKLDNTVYMRDEDQTFTGYIDYGYYVEYEEIADITITVTMQENIYHYCNTNPSYIMRISRSGQEVNMWFSAQSVTQSTKPTNLYPIQEVMLRPDIPQIRDKVRYTAINTTGRIVEDGGQLYLLYSENTGTARIKATFDGDATYAPAEAIYNLTIQQSTKPVAPIDFPESDIYTPENQYNVYPVQQPQSTDGNNYDLSGHLTWTYPSGWYRNTEWGGHVISPTEPLTEDTDVVIKCYLEETQFQEKYMQYTLHIQAAVRLNASVHNDYNLEVETHTELKLELLKWPISQGYVYNSSDWSIIRWNIGYKDRRYEQDIISDVTCEQVGGYNVLYYNCTTNTNITYDTKYTIDISFNGNSSYKDSDWGLYIQLTKLEEHIPVDPQEPNIRFKQDIYNYTLWGDEVDSAELPTPTIVYNPEYNYPIEYTYTYWVAIPNVDNPQSYLDFTKVGQGVETSEDIIENVQEGYYIVECTTIASDYFHSKTITTVLHVIRQYNRVDPDIALYKNNIKVENIEEVHTFQIPGVQNSSNVEYKWYINNNEITVDENGYFEYHPYSDFVLELRTTQTKSYNSISLYCNYINLVGIDYFGFQSVEDNNEIYWCSSVKNWPKPTLSSPYISNNIYWSKDKVNWTGVYSSKDQTYITTLNCGENIYFKGVVSGYTDNGSAVVHYEYPLKYAKNLPFSYDNNIGVGLPDGVWNYFASTKQFDVFGNIMTLLYGDHLNGQILYGSDQATYNYDIHKYMFPDGYASNISSRNNYAFAGLFFCLDKGRYKYAHVRYAHRLILPEVNAPVGCYADMFRNCTELLTKPTLPATQLSYNCYKEMFYGCTSLNE